MTEQQIIETLATKVMGWEIVPFGDTELFRSEAGYVLKENWNPLQNIADAWQVVEKFREQGVFISLFPTPTGFIAEIWKIYEGEYIELVKGSAVEVSAAQEAICKAAVKTLEGQA